MECPVVMNFTQFVNIESIPVIANKLGEARINVTAVGAVAAGRRRYGAILWVKSRDVRRAAEILGAS